MSKRKINEDTNVVGGGAIAGAAGDPPGRSAQIVSIFARAKPKFFKRDV